RSSARRRTSRCVARFLENERLPFDNNASERALRVVALGRHWSLMGSLLPQPFSVPSIVRCLAFLDGDVACSTQGWGPRSTDRRGRAWPFGPLASGKLRASVLAVSSHSKSRSFAGRGVVASFSSLLVLVVFPAVAYAHFSGFKSPGPGMHFTKGQP